MALGFGDGARLGCALGLRLAPLVTGVVLRGCLSSSLPTAPSTWKPGTGMVFAWPAMTGCEASVLGVVGLKGSVDACCVAIVR